MTLTLTPAQVRQLLAVAKLRGWRAIEQACKAALAAEKKR